MMDNSLHVLLENINLQYYKLKNLSSTETWDKEFIEKVKFDFTYNSNKLEGNALTYGETISYLKNISTPKKSHKDLLDIENHFGLLDKIFEQFEQPFSVSFLKEIHKELMKDEDQWEFETLPNPGQFKIFENYAVRITGEIKSYLKPDQIENATEELMERINSSIANYDLKNYENHPLHISSLFHNQFLNVIHPFQDGNGRVGRIITNLILLKCDLPPIFIDTKDDVEREKYLNIFLECEQMGNLDRMTSYLGQKLLESIERKYLFIQEKNG